MTPSRLFHAPLVASGATLLIAALVTDVLYWRTALTQWENFSTKSFTVRFPGAPREFVGFVVRTYYRKQMQDIAAAPPSLRPLAPLPLLGGAL